MGLIITNDNVKGLTAEMVVQSQPDNNVLNITHQSYCYTDEIPLVAEDFSRVILNLCNNGFDAMREKVSANGEKYHSKLTVRTRKTETGIAIQIEDNDPGIPDKIKDKILQPFFTTKKGTAGTGLGLSITNDIIKAHGGSLDIESEPGKTVFTITLSR